MAGPVEIIIPVFNEGENIVRTLEEIEASVKHPHQIAVVYDFEEDNTLPPLRRFMESRGTGASRRECVGVPASACCATTTAAAPSTPSAPGWNRPKANGAWYAWGTFPTT